jgi:hypothetical protein
MGEMTLVNQKWADEIDEVEESEEFDPAATIVISKKDLLLTSETIEVDGPPVQLQTTLTTLTTLTSGQDFDMTLVPGKVEPLFVDEVQELPIADYEDEVIDDAHPVHLERSFVDDSGDDFHDQAEVAMPRSVSPVWLALGVILMIVLLGIGVYYVRVSQ